MLSASAVGRGRKVGERHQGQECRPARLAHGGVEQRDDAKENRNQREVPFETRTRQGYGCTIPDQPSFACSKAGSYWRPADRADALTPRPVRSGACLRNATGPLTRMRAIMQRLFLSGALLFASAYAFAQTPYAGMQARSIKALSEQQVSDLSAGRGMG